MKISTNRFCAVLLCFITVLALLTLKTTAELPVDTAKKCSLEIVFAPEGINASGVEFKAYKVASVTASYEFSVEPDFKKQEITKLLENPNTENYRLLSSTLSGFIASDNKVKPKYTALSNQSGTAVFKGMETGLYLITGEVYKDENACYIPQSFMVSLPKHNSDGSYNYDISAETKWEKRLKDDKLDLEVLKVWKDSATNLHKNDNVTVELYRNGKLYATVILNKNNSWKHKWNNLSAGDLWTVRERNFKGYTATVERKEDCFLITNIPKNPEKTPSVIPQTGLLQWPVPILTAGGILFIIIGIYLKRKGEK